MGCRGRVLGWSHGAQVQGGGIANTEIGDGFSRTAFVSTNQPTFLAREELFPPQDSELLVLQK
jgi:hypothetical protein